MFFINHSLRFVRIFLEFKSYLSLCLQNTFCKFLKCTLYYLEIEIQWSLSHLKLNSTSLREVNLISFRNLCLHVVSIQFVICEIQLCNYSWNDFRVESKMHSPFLQLFKLFMPVIWLAFPEALHLNWSKMNFILNYLENQK